MGSNINKEEILGMPFGTATARLRKSIMFLLAQKADLDTCCRCELKIETVEEFSIEHVKPWESSRHRDLFFDLDNIAFSHRKCNRPHVYTSRNSASLPRGEDIRSSKLTDVEVFAIRRMANEGLSISQITAFYPVSRAAIRCVVLGLTWRHLLM